MHLPLNSQANLLLKCLPVGATYVVEGHGGEDGDLQVSSRYVVLPTGHRINVPADFEQSSSPRMAPPRRLRGGRKAQNHRKSRAVTGRKKMLRRGGTSR